jgi:hypothetical protein
LVIFCRLFAVSIVARLKLDSLPMIRWDYKRSASCG